MPNNYSGRGYVSELNKIHLEPQLEEDFSAFDDGSLDIFTSATFPDFDTGAHTDFHGPAKPGSDTAVTKPADPTSATSVLTDFTTLDFPSGDFHYGDFSSSYTSPTLGGNFPENLNLQPIQPNPHGVYPYGSQNGAQSAQTGEKRKAGEPAPPSRPMSFEEASRLAAEEDKRRRNTAASARFRVKKKQREMALEKSAKEMNDKVSALENKISALETENNWLKKLILEKNDNKEGAGASLKGSSKKGKDIVEDEIVASEPKKVKLDAST